VKVKKGGPNTLNYQELDSGPMGSSSYINDTKLDMNNPSYAKNSDIDLDRRSLDEQSQDRIDQ
jgi:hypothetical protein